MKIVNKMVYILVATMLILTISISKSYATTSDEEIIKSAKSAYKSGLTTSQLNSVISEIQSYIETVEKMSPRPGDYETKKQLLAKYQEDLKNATPITKAEAKKLSKDELAQRIGELTSKRSRQGGSLSEKESKDLEIYESVWQETATEPGIQEKDLAAGDDPITNPDAYKPNSTGGNTKFIGKANIIIGTIRVVGTVIAVVALMIIGLRYMFGSVEERANYKETMVPYLIGAIMIFTIPNLLGIVYDLVSSIKF